ncbi:MAG: hypothetical protein ACOC3G_00780 [Phycisphaeraceae bacterium]
MTATFSSDSSIRSGPTSLNGHAAADSMRLRRQAIASLGERLRSVILLGGSLRKTRLVEGTGRAVVDLPLSSQSTFLGQWVEQAGMLAEHLGRDTLQVRMLLGANVPRPESLPTHPRVDLVVEGDSEEYRGTAGLLRDKTEQYSPSDMVLVANAGQLLLYSLSELGQMLAETGGDATILAHRDGQPAGMMLFRVSALRDVPRVGYQDFKEQALPKIAEQHEVMVVNHDRHTAVPVRTRSDYIRAVRIHHRRMRGLNRPGPFEEDWRSTFAIVEPGASLAGSVRVHDSVVLRGATIEGGAVLVRSVACPNSRITRDTRATDALVVGRWRRDWEHP